MVALPNARISFFGGPHPGRERQGLQLFMEAQQFYTQLKQKGEIDSYESFVFDDFNAELSGLTIIRADPAKLEKLNENDDVVGLAHRLELVARSFKVLRGFFGDNLQSRMANYGKQVDLLK